VIIKVVYYSITGHFLATVTDNPCVDEIADRHPLEIADKRSEAVLAPMKVDALSK
jgi:hypothetical protein